MADCCIPLHCTSILVCGRSAAVATCHHPTWVEAPSMFSDFWDCLVNLFVYFNEITAVAYISFISMTLVWQTTAYHSAIMANQSVASLWPLPGSYTGTNCFSGSYMILQRLLSAYLSIKMKLLMWQTITYNSTVLAYPPVASMQQSSFYTTTRPILMLVLKLFQQCDHPISVFQCRY
jgi:hypothetical protein